MPGTVIHIPFRFRGPPMSGNGGYVAGLIAGLLDAPGAVEVTLRSPIPLDTDLRVERGTPLVVVHGETLVAEARPAPLELDVPDPPDWDEALAARAASPSFAKGMNDLVPGGTGFHPVCYCCGVENPDGLHVHAAPVRDGAQAAAAWATEGSWGDPAGNLPAAALWTALDCPGQFAWLAGGVRTGMLGRLTGEVLRPAPAGARYVVSGWRIEVERRKHFAGTAVFDAAGRLVARARAVWIGTMP
jgi:hypothetical protein